MVLYGIPTLFNIPEANQIWLTWFCPCLFLDLLQLHHISWIWTFLLLIAWRSILCFFRAIITLVFWILKNWWIACHFGETDCFIFVDKTLIFPGISVVTVFELSFLDLVVNLHLFRGLRVLFLIFNCFILICSFCYVPDFLLQSVHHSLLFLFHHKCFTVSLVGPRV